MTDNNQRSSTIQRLIRSRSTQQGANAPLLNNGVSIAERLTHHRAISGNRGNTVRENTPPTPAPAPAPQVITSSPRISQGRLILSNFGINQWDLTAEHIRGLNAFIRLLLNTVTYEILMIEGRASNTGPESEHQVRPQGQGPGNIELSRLRADNVAQFLANRGFTSAFTPQLVAHGSSSPLVLAGGEVDVNRSVVISYTYVAELPAPEPLPPLPLPDPIVSQHWALSLNFSVSAGHIIAGYAASGKLKNLKNGNVFNVSFLVLGFGEGYASGGGGPDSFESFRTQRPLPALSFHRRYCRISSISGGIIIGGGYTVIKIPDITDQEITISGMSLGVVGADITGGIVGAIWLQESSLRRARQELRDYNQRVEAFNRRQRQRRGE